MTGKKKFRNQGVPHTEENKSKESKTPVLKGRKGFGWGRTECGVDVPATGKKGGQG